MNQGNQKQTIGHNTCPIMDKTTAAKFLGISDNMLSKMEKAGFILHDMLPGFSKPMYLRDRLDNFSHELQEWRKKHPEKYREIIN